MGKAWARREARTALRAAWWSSGWIEAIVVGEVEGKRQLRLRKRLGEERERRGDPGQEEVFHEEERRGVQSLEREGLHGRVMGGIMATYHISGILRTQFNKSPYSKVLIECSVKVTSGSACVLSHLFSAVPPVFFCFCFFFAASFLRLRRPATHRPLPADPFVKSKAETPNPFSIHFVLPDESGLNRLLLGAAR